MAPALESPATQEKTSCPPKRALRVLPIVPAIPRNLEKKSKQNPKTSSNEKVATSPAGQSTNVVPDEGTLSALNAQSSRSDNSTTSPTVGEPIQPISHDEALDGDKTPSVSTPEDPGQKEEIVDSLTSTQSEPSPLVPPSPEHSESETQNAVQDTKEEPAEVGETTVSEQPSKSGHQPLRATASEFHAHPISPDDLAPSPSVSPNGDANLARLEPSTAESTSAAETTALPTEPLYDGYGHAHNISFYPQPPLSSDDPSSPTRSIYQGYAYNPDPRQSTYSPHAHVSLQYPQSYQPQLNGHISPERQYAQGSAYYGNMQPFPVMGSQAPLTPSATPLDSMPAAWKMPNGFTNGANGAGIDNGHHSHHRSSSHSTLRSDDFPQGRSKTVSGTSQPLQNGIDGIEGQRMDEARFARNGHLPNAFNGDSLAAHLLNHFNVPDYADCEFVLNHGHKRFNDTRWYLSTILLTQSRLMQDLLKFADPADVGNGNKRVLRLTLTDRFITPSAMDSALRVLYGQSANTFTITNLEDSDREFAIISMKESLAFAGSGYLLNIKDIVLRGLQVASEILKWDNLEQSLSFALESNIERGWGASSTVIPAYSSLLTDSSDTSPTSHVLFTPSSSSALTGPQSDQPSGSPLSPEQGNRSPPQSAYDLWLHCFDFLVRNFPPAWELDSSARPLADVDRLPVTAESRSPLSRSRLSRIQFGDHPSELAAKSNNPHVLLSSIVLSISFPKLEYLLAAVGDPLSCNIKNIIRERERRRKIILQSKSVPFTERMDAKDQRWVEAGFEEAVETKEDGMISITRKSTGFARDPSSGNASIR